MRNLICIFFGHNEDEKLLPDNDTVCITSFGVPLAKAAHCKRCGEIYWLRLRRELKK